MSKARVLPALGCSLALVSILLLVSLSHLPPARAQQSQVALTASYSVIGGGASESEDLLSYYFDGNPLVVQITETPTVYMVDSGSQWSVLAVLNGSSSSERWEVATSDISGEITTPLTVSFTYYNQYMVNFKYNVTGGGAYSPPQVTFSQFGSSVTAQAGQEWVDASSGYSYSPALTGGEAGERWIASSTTTGEITQYGPVSVSYVHQFLITSSYSVVFGGSPLTPTLASKSLGQDFTDYLTTSPQAVWADSGATYTFTPSIQGAKATERWVATTASGHTLTIGTYNGTVGSPLTVSIAYCHQFEMSVDFSYVGGGLGAISPPTLSYESLEVNGQTGNASALWVDAGSAYSLPGSIGGASPSTERWVLNNATSGNINEATEIAPVYYHQYYVAFSYSVLGQGPTTPSGQPNISYSFYGNAQTLTLSLSQQDIWVDAGSTYAAASSLSASSSSERWEAVSATGAVTSSDITSGVVVSYQQQFLLTVAGGDLPTQWVDAGGNVTFSVPGVYGRNEGAGYRVISYQIDGGPEVDVPSPTASISVPLSMLEPHTITFLSVRQFEVTLDQGATAALVSITPPTIPGDSYWYDSGSGVTVLLNGVWGRASGVGQRITSVSATAEPTTSIDTVGAFQAYTNSQIASPVAITTTSVTQYEVVLNQAAVSALASISPPPSFANDDYWYNAGSPAVTIVLNGVFDRSAGTGMRVSSWELDSGAVTKVAQTGTITIVTKVMSSPQFVNATVVTQYQVTLDKGATSALSSMPSPSIPSDSGWYDASTPVTISLNGEWGRSSGTGQRLASYSLNGGEQVQVASSALQVITLGEISSPGALSANVVTQYQVTLDSGAAASLASITQTPIPQDKYWYDSGTAVSITLNGTWGRTATSGNRLLSYAVDGRSSVAVLSSAPVQVLSLPAIDGPQSVTTKTVSQFHLSSSPFPWVSATNSTLPGDAPGWYDSGTPVKVVFENVWGQTQQGSRENVLSYSINSGAKTDVSRQDNGTFTVSLTINQAETITLNSVTQYLFTASGPSQVTANPASPTKDSYFDSGAKETFTFARTWNGTSGTRYVLSSFSLNGASPTAVPSSTEPTFTTPTVVFTSPEALVVEGAAQYLVRFSFFDSTGRVLLHPSQVQLEVGNSTVNLQGPSTWMANATTFTIAYVVWEGASVGPTTLPSYQVAAAPLNVTTDIRAYEASLSVVDILGRPVAGAQVTMTLANGSTIAGTTNAQGVYTSGLIPLGPYTAKVSSFGTSAEVTGNAASGQPPPVVKVALSKTSVSVLVIVPVVIAVAGASAFFILRRARRGKGQERVSELK